MSNEKRFQAYEPLTVRAAARLVHLTRLGQVAPWELDRYLSELMHLDTRARLRGDVRRLRRLAFRRCALGHGVPVAPFALTRRRRTGTLSGGIALQLLPEHVLGQSHEPAVPAATAPG